MPLLRVPGSILLLLCLLGSSHDALIPRATSAGDLPDSSDVRPDSTVMRTGSLTLDALRGLRPGKTHIRVNTREEELGDVLYCGLADSAPDSLIIETLSSFEKNRVRRPVSLESVSRLDRWIGKKVTPRKPVLFYGLNLAGMAGGAGWAVSDTHSTVAVEILAGLGGAYLSLFVLSHLFEMWPVHEEPARWEQVYP